MRPRRTATFAVLLATSTLAFAAPGALAIEPRAGDNLVTELSWGLDRIDQRGADLDGRYVAASTGKGVTAYVVDSGIGPHEQLVGRVRPGFSAVDDGDGRADCAGHGTFVAGNLGGRTVGVAPGVTFVPVRVVGCQGNSDDPNVLEKATLDLVKGLDWIVEHHPKGEPAVANMSLTLGADDRIDAAVRRVVADGITVVVASGNDGIDSCTVSPGRMPEVISVNSIDRNGVRMKIGDLESNDGACSDIWAPGVDVLGPMPGTTDKYMPGSGTSMASPHVAGAAARLLEMDPTMTPAQVWQTMRDLASHAPVANAVAGSTDAILFLPQQSPPARVADPAFRRDDAGATISWQRPSTDGGARITDYVVRYRAAGSPWSRWVRTNATTMDVPASAAFVQVAARNAIGRGTVATLRG